MQTICDSFFFYKATTPMNPMVTKPYLNSQKCQLIYTRCSNKHRRTPHPTKKPLKTGAFFILKNLLNSLSLKESRPKLKSFRSISSVFRRSFVILRAIFNKTIDTTNYYDKGKGSTPSEIKSCFFTENTMRTP